MNKGLIYAMLSALMFSIMNVFVKKMSVIMGTGEIVFIRSIIGLVILSVIIVSFKIKFSKRDIPLLLFRGFMGGMSMYLIFYSISGMPLGDVSILQQLSAFFVLLISIIYLHDKVPAKSVVPLMVIVLGTCLVLKPWEYNSFSFYAIIAIISAFMAAVAYVVIHKIYAKGGHNAWEIVFYFLFCSTVVGAIGMYHNFSLPRNTDDILMLLGLGITSLLAQTFMTQAYGLANQILVSFIMYLGVFLNAVWGYCFFGEVMSWLSIVGGVLIIGSSFALSWVKADSVKRTRIIKRKEQHES